MSLVESLSTEDVKWAFRHIMGREIESPTDIDHFVRTEKDFRSFVGTLVNSLEYRSLFAERSGTRVEADGFLYEMELATQARVRAVLKLIEPQDIVGYEKIRVGSPGDGGYVMLDDFKNIDAAYSLGINDDVSWDLDVAGRGIDIYQYDHTISKLPVENPRFHWFKTGIAAKAEKEFDTLPNLMQRNGHAASSNLLLKCDIEGYEWEVLSAMRPEQLGQFRQIVIETHGWQWLSLADFGARIRLAMENVTATHRLVHIHANNHAAYSIVGGIALPAVLELTFVRVTDRDYRVSAETFPGPLDQPCKPGAADYFLGRFVF